MAKKSAGEFRNGMTLEIEGNVVQVLEFLHVKPGKGAAFVRTKLRNVINGGVIERTFRPTETFDEAYIERKKMQYLYGDGELFYFMDMETYDQIPVSAETLGDALKFVKENEEVTVMFYQGNAFSIDPYSEIIFVAVFSPILGTPGILSDVSPISAFTSINSVGLTP